MPDPKQIARRIFHETLASIDIPLAVERRISRVGQRICVDDWSTDLTKISNVRLVALGKAAHSMLSGFVKLFPDLAVTGISPGHRLFLRRPPGPERRQHSGCASRSHPAQNRFTKFPGRIPDFRRWLRLDGIPP